MKEEVHIDYQRYWFFKIEFGMDLVVLDWIKPIKTKVVDFCQRGEGVDKVKKYKYVFDSETKPSMHRPK